jgi:uncharacterized LabA/DUF88 family protein
MCKVFVFIDAQNCYRRARQTFFASPTSFLDGHTDPMKLARLLCTKLPPGQKAGDRVLAQVRIHTGRPDATRDPKSYAPELKRNRAWEAAGAIVMARTLRYPYNWPAQAAEEKGVDVALAVDIVTKAVDGLYDIGILMSNDTDLLPAVEYVQNMPNVRIETAAWFDAVPQGLIVSGIWAHRLDRADFRAVQDYTDYR